MQIVSDAAFWISAALLIAAIVALASSSVTVRDKGLLLGFCVLTLLVQIGSYGPLLLLRTGVVSHESYRSFSPATGALLAILRTAGWALLLAFIVGLRAVQRRAVPLPEGGSGGVEMTIARALTSFEGRLGRADYWLKGALFLLPVGVFNNVLIYGVNEGWSIALGSAMALVALWPSLALVVKRLHDRDHSGWFALIAFIPIVGSIWLLVEVWFLRGTVGPNRFGPEVPGPAHPHELPADPASGEAPR